MQIANRSEEFVKNLKQTNKQTKKKQKTGEYHDLQVQRNTLFLADGFQSFRNMCLKINGLDPVHFLSTPMSA